MNELQQIKKFIHFVLPFSFFFFLFLVLMMGSSAGGDATVMVGNFFTPPFEDTVSYQITSSFGTRLDPFGSEEEKFHTGIDLAAPDQTSIVASADGTVIEIGFSEDGLGNYVYIEHNFDGLIFYTAYGHMLDESIIVQEGQPIKKKEKIGTIGSTGASTGTHVHLSIMERELKFDQDHLVDPSLVFEK